MAAGKGPAHLPAWGEAQRVRGVTSRSKPKLSAKQRALYGFLRERDGKEVTDEDILKVTGWKASAWKVYCNNGLYAPFLVRTPGGRYRVRCGPDVSDWDFYKAVRQSKAGGGFAPRCKQPFARALAARSRDNMILALELYNRPSLQNRLDGFALLFCAAWEQLLKAEIVDEDSEDTIYRAKKAGRPRETISLRQAMDLRLDKSKSETRNLAAIVELRDKAAHLLMPEARPTLGYLFQAGVLNYARRFTAFTGDAFIEDTTGLVSLVGEGRTPPAAVLMHHYGDVTGGEISELLDRVRKEIADVDDSNYAITVEHRLVITKQPSEGDIQLGVGSGGVAGTVVEREVPTERKYPHLTSQLRSEVEQRLGRPFSSYDLQAVIAKEGWKASDNAHHKYLRVMDRHLYSERAVDDIVAKLEADAKYLERARASYRAAQAKRKPR